MATPEGEVENHRPSPENESKLFFPVCELSIVPFVGQTFGSLEEGEQFYENYAKVCGFKTRKSTIIRADDKEKNIITRYMLCNREGSRADNSVAVVDSNKQKKMRLSTRVECMARIVFQRVAWGQYRIKIFNNGHTHPMVKPEHKYLMTSNRRVDQVHQMFLLTGMKANIGPMRTFRFYKELVGGYDQIGCTSIDFKNYARDLRAYAEGVDAHILLEDFKKKQEECNGFKYFFDVCEDNILTRLFWADQNAVRNFSLFGEAISFDATYNTNR